MLFRSTLYRWHHYIATTNTVCLFLRRTAKAYDIVRRCRKGLQRPPASCRLRSYVLGNINIDHSIINFPIWVISIDYSANDFLHVYYTTPSTDGCAGVGEFERAEGALQSILNIKKLDGG